MAIASFNGFIGCIGACGFIYFPKAKSHLGYIFHRVYHLVSRKFNLKGFTSIAVLGITSQRTL